MNSGTSTKRLQLADLWIEAAGLLKPPERLSVAEAAEKYRVVNNPGAYIGPWQNATTPYMVEPMDVLASDRFNAEVFVGPAQCGKTDALFINWIAYSVAVDPMDMLLFSPTQQAARDFSMRRLDRLHRHSPDVGAKLLKDKDSDNKFDKHYTSGVMVTLGHPSVSQLAGRPVGRTGLTDYDRMDDDIDGEGSPFDLARKRTTTFGRFAMTLAESSPSRPITNPHWVRQSPHEAPPTTGILALYNRGDRRRWYWPCPDCGEYFEGRFDHLQWKALPNAVDAAETVRMLCPLCSYEIHPDQRHEMQQRGRWVKDGQRVSPKGVVTGEGERSDIASFWLNGIAAAFVTWPKLVLTYIQATAEYERTGSEDALVKFYNTDLGEPYLPKNLDSGRLPEVLKERAEDVEEKTVPDDVRFLVAAVDVQRNAFVVQVAGIAPGDPFDMWIVDRYTIHRSNRTDPADPTQFLWVKPGTYLEDWQKLSEQVIGSSYPLADGSGRRMMVKLTVCDSGGRDGVTGNAYNFWRGLKKTGLHNRFHLVKGDHILTKPRAYIDYPDSKQKGAKAVARGDVPVLFLNSNLLKDTLAHRLDSTVPGRGMVRFPDWLPDYVYTELCAEQKTDKGWVNPPHTRNEAWDLAYYVLGACASPLLQAERIDWDNPPGWAAPWGSNSLVFAEKDNRPFANPPKSGIDLAKLAASLA